jgi:hypothetical protein
MSGGTSHKDMTQEENCSNKREKCMTYHAVDIPLKVITLHLSIWEVVIVQSVFFQIPCSLVGNF